MYETHENYYNAETKRFCVPIPAGCPAWAARWITEARMASSDEELRAIGNRYARDLHDPNTRDGKEYRDYRSRLGAVEFRSAQPSALAILPEDTKSPSPEALRAFEQEWPRISEMISQRVVARRRALLNSLLS
jgi:hypothetical protein